MKKKIFLVLSAVTVLTMGVVMVACSKESNALNPNEEVVVEEVVPMPTLQKTNSAEEWAAFNLEIEKLNAKYLAPEVVGKAMRVGRDSGNLSKDEYHEIWEVDAEGAKYGSAVGSAIGGIIGVYAGVGTPIGPGGGGVVGGGIGFLLGASIIGAAASISKWWELTSCGLMVALNPLPSIDDLESDSLVSAIGRQHNMIIEDFINSPMDLSGVSDSMLLLDLSLRYERLFGIIPDTVKSIIINTRLDAVSDFSVEVKDATLAYREAVVDMNDNQKHDYTERYLEIADSTLSDSEEKVQISTYACVAYYSSAMWELKE